MSKHIRFGRIIETKTHEGRVAWFSYLGKGKVNGKIVTIVPGRWIDSDFCVLGNAKHISAWEMYRIRDYNASPFKVRVGHVIEHNAALIESNAGLVVGKGKIAKNKVILLDDRRWVFPNEITNIRGYIGDSLIFQNTEYPTQYDLIPNE